MSSIPVQNIYYMFCYAWKHFKSGEDILVGADSYSSLFELLVKVFLKEASTIVRRGLDQEYITEHEDLASPKGKILIGESIKRNLITRHRLHCAHDELSSNILHNQIIKACLERIMQSPDIDKFHRDQAKILSYRFKDVTSTNLKAIDFLSLRLHRNNAHYKLVLKIGELIYPTVTESIYLEYIIQGHRMRIISLDLNQDWKEIRDDLLQIISA